jgi:hypothetical protein
MRKLFVAAGCGLVVSVCSMLAQTAPAYLDIGRAQVRAEKSKEYEDAVKKLVEVNRKYKGDQWIALSAEYGESGTLIFSSSRENMGAVETGGQAFMKALTRGLGPMADKLVRDLGAWSTSYHTEIRRRRWDLSVHAPPTAADLYKLVGQSRWIRTLKLDIKPGKNLEYIDAWKGFQAELAKMQPPSTVLVSESVTGTPAIFVGLYYKTMAEMDSEYAAVQKALASGAYQYLTVTTSNAVNQSTWEILRVRPDLSNPPEEVVNADPAFWKPKPPAPPKPKAEAPAPAPAPAQKK